ncbi:hypothetical protein [Myxococcus xanthus]|uniref:hypothetical protein n=1 Tax=Myxococcus xanthus TaxID=34 RepID=UPI001F2FB569|nr:hypothetical protein [Myxococcus xanthus]
MNNALTKIATAQPSTSGRYPRFGNYLLEVAVVRVKEGFKGDSAIAELKVRESTPLTGGESPSRVGATVENLSDAKKGGSGRFKSFLMALVGGEEYEFANPAALKKFVDERQAGTHLLVGARSTRSSSPRRTTFPGRSSTAIAGRTSS